RGRASRLSLFRLRLRRQRLRHKPQGPIGSPEKAESLSDRYHCHRRPKFVLTCQISLCKSDSVETPKVCADECLVPASASRFLAVAATTGNGLHKTKRPATCSAPLLALSRRVVRSDKSEFIVMRTRKARSRTLPTT